MEHTTTHKTNRRRRIPLAFWIFVVPPGLYLAGMHLPGHRLTHSQRGVFSESAGVAGLPVEETLDRPPLWSASRSSEWDRAPRQATPGTSGHSFFRLRDPSGTRELMFFADTRTVEPDQSHYGYPDVSRKFEVPDLPEGRGTLTCVARRLVGSRWARDGLRDDDIRRWLYDGDEPADAAAYQTLVKRVELAYVLETEPDGTTRLTLKGDAGLRGWHDFHWEVVAFEQRWAMVPTVLKLPVAIAGYLFGPLPPGG